MTKNFKEVERSGETIWVHKTEPVWIVKYDAIEDSNFFRYEMFQVYRAIEPIKRSNVWAHNNKRVGGERGFRTLKEAMAAVA